MGQIQKFIAGIILMLVIAVIDIRYLLRFAYLGYIAGLGLLLMVYFFGSKGGLGAQRWLEIGSFKFQPSEIMKVMLIIALARYFHRIHSNYMLRFRILIIPLLLVGVAVGLIFVQPNLGTTIITFAMSVFIFFMAGVGWKKFLLAGIFAIGILPLLWANMHEYQKLRITTFLNPELDAQGAGYNVIQSMVSIGAGGFDGAGLLQGTQSQLKFVPESKTDFIFTIIAEEFGFIGSLVVILLYAALILYGFRIARQSASVFGKLIAYGISSFVFLHVFINIGMVSGILPVVGIPLPLISFGGSNLLSNLIGFALVVNVAVHKRSRLQ